MLGRTKGEGSMNSVIIFACALLFARWIIDETEDPQVWYNAIAAIGCAGLFVMLVLGVFELCGCAM